MWDEVNRGLLFIKREIWKSILLDSVPPGAQLKGVDYQRQTNPSIL